MGVSKREMLEDYYPDELAAVFDAWAKLHGAGAQADAEAVSVKAFLEM